MPDNMDRVGVFAEVATAAAGVTYPLVKVFGAYLERRREKLALQYGAPAAAVEMRLIERCAELEARLERLEDR